MRAITHPLHVNNNGPVVEETFKELFKSRWGKRDTVFSPNKIHLLALLTLELM